MDSFWPRDRKIGSCVHGNNFINCLECAGPRAEKLIEAKTSSPWPSPLPNTGIPYIDEFLSDCFKTMREKGNDYREGNSDLLHNFTSVGVDSDIPPQKVWYVYASKHWKALKTYIKSGGQSESEPIEGRIKDLIVYLVLFYEFVHRQKRLKDTK